MREVKEGPQPPACVVESCDRPPANGMVGYCAAHRDHYANGSAATPPIVEPDDPALLEREARKAADAEAKEYAERRRVKTWKTLENGSRVPEEYWTDEELEAIEAEVAQDVVHIGGQAPVTKELVDEFRYASRVTTPSYSWEFDPKTGEHIRPDPEKAQLKLLRRALRGKYGQGPQLAVQGLVEMLEGQ
jgi:hypothetical protein